MANFPVIVISAPNSGRRGYFSSDFRIADLLNPVFMNATMLNEEYPRDRIDPQSLTHHKVLYGRELLNAEIGCAISNRRAQSIIANSEFGGLIVEDDARFTDLDRLVKVVDRFLAEKRGMPAILSLFDGKEWEKISSGFRLKHPYIRSIGATPFTVAYALTPLAAEQLILANAESAFVADWPATNCYFYSSTLGLVNHGDSSTQSLIDKTEVRAIRNPIKRRLLIFSGIFYLTNFKHIESFSVFFNQIWLPRLQFYASRLLFGILRTIYPSENK